MLLGVKVVGVKNGKSASYEVRQKLSSDWPLVQAAVAFTLEEGKARNVQVVLGHVAPTPLVSEAAARAAGPTPYRLRPRPALKVKNRTQPVQVYEVDWLKPGGSQQRQGTGSLEVTS
jgi:CO/xanthine dehydrogenase FAD-binding subunit